MSDRHGRAREPFRRRRRIRRERPQPSAEVPELAALHDMGEPLRIEIAPDDCVSARVYPAAASGRAGIALMLAHGAGAGQNSAFLVRFATGLAARGIDAVTFNFSYTE